MLFYSAKIKNLISYIRKHADVSIVRNMTFSYLKMIKFLGVFFFLATLMVSPQVAMTQEDKDNKLPDYNMEAYISKTIYPQVKPFKGIIFKIDEENRRYLPNDPMFHNLLSTTPIGKNLIEEYKKQMKIAKPLALMGTVITLADVVWFINNPNAPKENSLLFSGSLLAGQLLNLSASYFKSKGQIALYAAIREYNQNAIPLELNSKRNPLGMLQLKLDYNF